MNVHRSKTAGRDLAPMPNSSDTLSTEPSQGFVTTPLVEQITRRALTYLQAGYPVHFAGVAGTGKTTLAFHVAAQLIFYHKPVHVRAKHKK